MSEEGEARPPTDVCLLRMRMQWILQHMFAQLLSAVAVSDPIDPLIQLDP